MAPPRHRGGISIQSDPRPSEGHDSDDEELIKDALPPKPSPPQQDERLAIWNMAFPAAIWFVRNQRLERSAFDS